MSYVSYEQQQVEATRYIYVKKTGLHELLIALSGGKAGTGKIRVEEHIDSMLRDVLNILESNCEEIAAPMATAYIRALLGEAYDENELVCAHQALGVK